MYIYAYTVPQDQSCAFQFRSWPGSGVSFPVGSISVECWSEGAPLRVKAQRQNAIRELVGSTPVQNQDELRRKLRRRGFAVTQATLSRDMHELHLSKGPSGYSLPNANGHSSGASEEDDDSPPSVAEVIESFGLRVTQAMNQVILGTVTGGAQPVATAIDYEEWPEVVGTIAGDDIVLIICPDSRRASDVLARLRAMLES